jgi:hypothetical protein
VEASCASFLPVAHGEFAASLQAAQGGSAPAQGLAADACLPSVVSRGKMPVIARLEPTFAFSQVATGFADG